MISNISFLSFVRDKKQFNYSKAGFLKLSPLQKDTVNFCQNPRLRSKEKVEKYKQNKNVPIDSLFKSETDKEVYRIIKQARDGNEIAMMILKKAKIESEKEYYKGSSKNKVIERLADLYKSKCKTYYDEPVKFNPIEYPRIYRTIGESEYKALLNGEHIVSESCITGVDVTNKPTGVATYTIGKKYFVTFKEKDNFDPFLSDLFDCEKNFIPHVKDKNPGMAQYILEGGYDLNDVETITEMTDKFPKSTDKIVYSSENTY